MSSWLQMFPERVEFYRKKLDHQVRFGHYFLILRLFCVFVTIFHWNFFQKPDFWDCSPNKLHKPFPQRFNVSSSKMLSQFLQRKSAILFDKTRRSLGMIFSFSNCIQVRFTFLTMNCFYCFQFCSKKYSWFSLTNWTKVVFFQQLHCFPKFFFLVFLKKSQFVDSFPIVYFFV